MIQYDEQHDYIVIGSGAGSMCAALRVAKAGKKVLLLEKSEWIGGTTARSGGVMWIPNNPFMKRDGVEDSAEQATRYLDALAEGQPPLRAGTPERRAAFIEEGPKMLQFLTEQGVRLNRVDYWPDYYDELPGGSKPGRTVVSELFNMKELGPWRKRFRKGFLPLPLMLQDALKMNRVKREWPARLMLLRFIGRLLGQVLTGKRFVSAGAALQGQLLKACLAAGVDVRTSMPVTELLTAEGRVVGVRAGGNGGSLTFSSKLGVLVDAGGFARNQGLRDRYLPGTKTDWSNTVESDTGDLLEMMMTLGADTEGLGLLLGYQSMIPPGKEDDMIKPGAQKQGAAPHSIVVDQTGVRYLNEGGSYVAFVKNMMDRNAENPGSALPSWIIMDAQAAKKYGIAGVKKKATLQKWVESGYLKTADSPRALAEALNMDPATLSSTIERFNGMVEKQCDDDFARGKRAYDQWLGDPYNAPNASLGKLEVGPFYAVPVLPGDVSTLGGVVTDVHARVLTSDGEVIPGLYATGVAAASPFGQVYPGAGASIGPAYTFGYVAAGHALSTNT